MPIEDQRNYFKFRLPHNIMFGSPRESAGSKEFTEAVIAMLADPVFPAPHIRKPVQRIALTTAFTGVRFHPDRLRKPDGTRDKVPTGHVAAHMPITAQEIGWDAREAYEAGSRYMHLHARNPMTGRQSGNHKDYAEAFSQIRGHVPGILLSGPTSRKEDVATVINERMADLKLTGDEKNPAAVAQAEMARAMPALRGGANFLTIATEPDIMTPEMIGPFLTGDAASLLSDHTRRWPETMLHYFHKLTHAMNQTGAKHEVEIMHMGMFNTLRALIHRGVKIGGEERKLHAVVLLGFSQQLPINKETFQQSMTQLELLRHEAKLDLTVSVGAVIMPAEATKASRVSGQSLPAGEHDYREVIEWVVEHNKAVAGTSNLPVHMFRTGLEDAPVMYGEQETNARLTDRAASIFGEHRISIIRDQEEVNRRLLTRSSGSSILTMRL